LFLIKSLAQTGATGSNVNNDTPGGKLWN
jgi:hypothetical protein